jgi:hypothetical protein
LRPSSPSRKAFRVTGEASAFFWMRAEATSKMRAWTGSKKCWAPITAATRSKMSLLVRMAPRICCSASIEWGRESVWGPASAEPPATALGLKLAISVMPALVRVLVGLARIAP